MGNLEVYLHPRPLRRLLLPPLRMFFDLLRQTDRENSPPTNQAWVAVSSLLPRFLVVKDIVKEPRVKAGIPTPKPSGELFFYYYPALWRIKKTSSIDKKTLVVLVRSQQNETGKKTTSELVISRTQRLVCMTSQHVFRLAHCPIAGFSPESGLSASSDNLFYGHRHRLHEERNNKQS